jgi:hypothetical protein
VPIDRLAPNQVLNRQCTLNAVQFGFFDAITMGEIANAVNVATLPTGQQRPAGQIQATDVTGTVMLAQSAVVAILEAWKGAVDVGAPGSVVRGGGLQYWNEDGTPGPLLVVEEMFVHTLSYPSTDITSAEGAQLSFTLSVFNSRILPAAA